jgi:DNA-binding transcriptional regulator LsrR (DeoR family)
MPDKALVYEILKRFKDNKLNGEIAEELDIQRSVVTRAVSEAFRHGIITLHPPTELQLTEM